MQPVEGGGIEIEIVGELASMVEVALAPEGGGAKTKTALRDAERRSVKVVAGARNHCRYANLSSYFVIPNLTPVA